MKKRKFIINPVSGKGINQSTIDELKAFFVKRIGDFDYTFSDNTEDIVTQTRLALKMGYEQIVAVGGDGTVHQVVNGFFENGNHINAEASLAVSNLGTGSEYFKTLQAGNRKLSWMQMIIEDRIQEVDIGYVNFASNKLPNHFFVNMAGIGISSDITLIKSRYPGWFPKSLKYIAPTVQAIIGHQPTKAVVTLDEQEIEVNLTALFVCKGTYAGGGMKFGAGADLRDGYFDVTVVGDFKVAELLSRLDRLYSGDVSKIKGVQKLKAQNIKVTSQTPIGVELDGENCGSTDLSIELKPKFLKVCIA